MDKLREVGLFELKLLFYLMCTNFEKLFANKFWKILTHVMGKFQLQGSSILRCLVNMLFYFKYYWTFIL